MYTRTRRKKRTTSMEATTGEREADEEDNNNDSQISKVKQDHDRQKDLPKTINLVAPASLSSLAVPISNESHDQPHHSSAIHIAHLLHEANLSELIPVDLVSQFKFFLNDRSHLHNQIEFVRTQFEKQYNSLKNRLDETETENERLTAQHRSSTKQLLLYKNLVEDHENTNSSTKTKDYQQLKLTIDAVLKENERLYAEIHDFKTSDPVYEQVQLLETANKHLKQELIHATNDNHRLKQMINIDEIKQLKLKLSKSTDECEKLKLLNKKLINEVQIRQRQLQTSSPKQLRVYPHSPSQQQQQQFQLSPISQHSAISPPASTIVSRRVNENISPLTIQNLRQFEVVSHYPVPISSASSDIAQLKDHVHLLEQKLQQREYELQTLQIEIEKGTSSIMSSIEDLYIASSSVSPSQQSPSTHFALANVKNQPTIEELQNELDQLHDKLDELTRENQMLKNRTQEFDTIYEENEYLYAEKSQWNEEIERTRIRELVLEQEIRTLKEREKEFLVTNDSNANNLSATQSKLKIDWLHQTNNQLELEIVRLREQLDLLAKKCQEVKKGSIHKDEHYKQLLAAAEDKQQLPQELVRLERIKVEMESQMEKERQDYQKTIAGLEEQTEKREQKYSSLYETILKLQNDYRQKELDYVQQMEDVIKQRDELHVKVNLLQNEYEQIQQENKALKEEIKSKDEINRDLKLAVTSSNNDTQTIYNQLRQLNTNLTDLQHKYERDIAERDKQIEMLQNDEKQIISNYDGDLLHAHQTIIQLQHDNKQYLNQIETYRSNCDKLQTEVKDKQHFLKQIQNDLTERSALHININNQLSQENKGRIAKIAELEQAVSEEQKRNVELQQTVQALELEVMESRAIAKESLEKSQELERRFHETDKNFEETIRTQINETAEPTRRELNLLRAELVTKSDQITRSQHTIEEEKLKRQRLEMKLKRLKDEYVNIRKELYNRIEENNTLQHELVECRFKNDYNIHVTNQTFNALKTPNEKEPTAAVQLYLKEKSENQHWQLKCRTYQQKVEQLQKNYELTKEKHKQRLQEERELFERTKNKYFEHLKNVQRDLHETRQLLEKDTELKLNQESAYQQLIDERRQLLTSMVDKDAKVREMRRENLLLTSKIQLLEDQMENLNERVDRTLRERNQLRREINSVRFDSNICIEASTRSSPSPSPSRATHIESTTWNQPVHHKESFGFANDHQCGASPVS
ncbi:unnamed protein product [Rotaria socialis]|uniref:Uncharacterized protein n=1 Tax=Rotaria socialis TaxID=392032 RepID=A0A818GC50_9BILA|nr:unnamed protein product [Rotaria socialis]CAF4254380.1 unnamed protein product [Rotaria socialis]